MNWLNIISLDGTPTHFLNAVSNLYALNLNQDPVEMALEGLNPTGAICKKVYNMFH